MKNNKHFILHSILFLLAIAAVLYASSIVKGPSLPKSQSEAESAYSISSDMLISQSSVEDGQSSTEFFLATDKKEGLYTLDQNTSAEVIDYLSNKPTYSLNADGTQTAFIQDDVSNIQLKSRLSDADANAFNLQGMDSGDTHYYFQQMRCDGVPVYSSYTNVHVNADNEIYSIGGALTKTGAECERKVSRLEAENIAREEFRKDRGVPAISVVQSSESVYSPTLSEQESDSAYLTQRVELCADFVCHAYFVDLGNGVVRYDVQTSTDALNRSVSLTNGGSQRTEGSAPVSDQRVNKIYDLLGDTYNFYSNTFQRDSYNNNGGLLKAFVKPNCGNDIVTHWYINQMQFCTSTISLDVVVHEFQHGVTQVSGGLEYINESGALNESLSDIFGATADSGDWDMGEETEIRAIRNLKDPLVHGDPDNVYSQKYYCPTDPTDKQQQSTLVHTNSGVFNKAFYLMSDGGTFPAQNGCTVTGLGRTKAAQIIYKGLTTYIRGNVLASFKDMYNAVNSGCTDLHQANSNECQTVKRAMESVGMDKPEGEGCRGTTIGTMTCSGTPAPSGSPSGTPSGSPSASPSVSPSAQPSPSVTPEPTDVPAPTPATKADAPLLSPWSLPQILAGKVKITQEGSQYTVKATLEAKTLTGFAGNQLSNFDEDDAQGRLIGSKVLKTGTFKVEDGEIINEFTTTEDISHYSAYEVYFPASGSNLELPYLFADITGPITSEPGGQNKVVIALKLRFQGIESKPKSTEAILVRVGVGGGDLKDTQYKQVVFTPSGGGIWEGNAIFDIPEGSRYKVVVKGRNHRQKKYCENTPSESKPGEYICEAEAISLKKGVNTLDFSKVVQMAGDLNQDGIVNSQDMIFIRNNVGTQDIEKLVIGDVNKDGVLNAVDYALTKFTLLSNRRDGS